MKRNYWPAFFIVLFSFVFLMILWTVQQAISVPTVEDVSFKMKYQDVDDKYNSMMESNKNFLSKYDFKLQINDTKFDLTTEDIKYSQRVMEKLKKNKNLLKLGDNNIKVIVTNKITKNNEAVKIDILLTRTMTASTDIHLSEINFINNNNSYLSNVKIDEKNNWIITGSFNVDNEIGYIYIRANVL